MNSLMATVYIWEYDGKKFRILLNKQPFNLIIQEEVGGNNTWVTLEEKLLEELMHEGLDPLMLRAYDVVRAVRTVCEIINE